MLVRRIIIYGSVNTSSNMDVVSCMYETISGPRDIQTRRITTDIIVCKCMVNIISNLPACGYFPYVVIRCSEANIVNESN